MRKTLTNYLLPVIAMLALTGCILVNDFSSVWEKSTPDSCISKISEALYYSEFQRDPNGKDMTKHARVFTLGKHHFLMLKKEEADAGGRMYRFGIVHGIFQRYRLDPVMRDAFEITYPDAPVSFRHDTVTLENLSSEVMKLLEEISGKEEYWEIEDQTLYNPMLNDLCKYEDRDLDALRSGDKPKKANKTTKKAKQ